MLRGMRRDARWRGGVCAGFVVATAAAFALSRSAPRAAVAAWLYLPFVLLVALRWGRRAGIAAALIADILIVIFAVQPLAHSAANDRNAYVSLTVSTVGMVVVVLLVAYLNERLVQAEHERVAASERARAQQRFQALIEHSTSGIQLFSRDGKRLYVSPSTSSVVGYTPAELEQQDIFAAVEPEHRAAAARFFTALTRQPGASRTMELRVRHKDGTFRWIESTTTNLLEEPSVLAVVVNLRDVTARHVAEEELRRSRDELAAILRSVEDGITVQDGSGRLLYANEAAARLIGYPSAEALIDAPADEMFERFVVRDEAGAPVPFEQLPGQRVLRGEDVAKAVMRYQLRATAEERWSIVQAVPVRDTTGRVQLSVTAFQDITTLKQALTTAEEALATRDRFLSIASHELRTPLTILKGQIELGRRRLVRQASPDLLAHGLTLALEQVDRLNRLVGQLLDVSRLAAGHITVTPESVEFMALLRRVVEDAEALEPARQIDCLIPDGDVWLEADALRLEQVFVNLLQNARKYSAEDTVIHLQITATPESVAIAVQDEGIGVPAADQALVFAPFQRGSNIDKGIAGLGLGLAIAQELVQAHGGTLTLVSEPGEGATFTVTLPRARDVRSVLTAEQERQ